VILPFSIVRWIHFKQIATVGESHVPAAATLVTAVIFSLSGVLNTVMYLLTQAWIFWPAKDDEPQAPDG
jgi:hypothetical protein